MKLFTSDFVVTGKQIQTVLVDVMYFMVNKTIKYIYIKMYTNKKLKAYIITIYKLKTKWTVVQVKLKTLMIT